MCQYIIIKYLIQYHMENHRTLKSPLRQAIGVKIRSPNSHLLQYQINHTSSRSSNGVIVDLSSSEQTMMSYPVNQVSHATTIIMHAITNHYGQPTHNSHNSRAIALSKPPTQSQSIILSPREK